jgi:hypothetical protein
LGRNVNSAAQILRLNSINTQTFGYHRQPLQNAPSMICAGWKNSDDRDRRLTKEEVSTL